MILAQAVCCHHFHGVCPFLTKSVNGRPQAFGFLQKLKYLRNIFLNSSSIGRVSGREYQLPGSSLFQLHQSVGNLLDYVIDQYPAALQQRFSLSEAIVPFRGSNWIKSVLFFGASQRPVLNVFGGTGRAGIMVSQVAENGKGFLLRGRYFWFFF